MGFYEPAKKSNPRSFNSKKYYKSKDKNVDGDRDDLFDLFWKELRERRTFHEGQEAVFKSYFEDNSKYIFNRWGRKGAKTEVNIVCSWGESLKGKNRICYIALPTKTASVEIYWDENRLQWCGIKEPDLFDMFVASVDKTNNSITFVNGSTIKLLGTWTEARSRGTQPNLFIADEVRDCSAEYLSGMEPNLAAKEDARCILSGTPPKKKNHFHEWEERIKNNPEGAHFHFSSYINTCLPHLKDWLDRKREELIAVGKEDEWLREYMAEDCFSSDERVLPDVHVEPHEDLMAELLRIDRSIFTPILGIFLTQQILCTCYVLGWKTRQEGMKMWVLDVQVNKSLWKSSFHSLYEDMSKKMEEIGNKFPSKWYQVVYDETNSFADVIPTVSNARKDLKWKERGIPLLREMILSNRMKFSTQSDQFAVESQGLFKEDDLKDFPTVCALGMIANEYYNPPNLSPKEKDHWDKMAPLREAGIVCNPPKSRNKKLFSINW